MIDSEGWGGGRGESIYDAVESVFESEIAKVNEQSDWEIHQPEIGQNLLVMDGREFLEGF